MSLVDYRNYLVTLVGNGLDLPDTGSELDDIGDALLVKFAFNQSLTVVDMYGALLGNALLPMCENNRQRVYLSTDICDNAPSHAKNIAATDKPFPVYTAVLGDTGFEQEWFEFTPYEVGWELMCLPGHSVDHSAREFHLIMLPSNP